MLDDLKLIHQRDAQDALGVVEKQWQQLTHLYQAKFQPQGDINNVIVAGMGGSALAANLVKSWPGLSVPFEFIRDYSLPNYVSTNTLFIASSYSGNTEETLAALGEAQEKSAQIIVIAAGGKLADIAKEKGYPFYQIPQGFQPRMAVFYNFTALVQLLESAGLVKSGAFDELKAAANWLGEQVKTYLPDVATKNNPAKKLAQELVGNSIVVYSSSQFSPVAYKWKINFNENSKTVAWCNALPEFNHNEFLGWTEQPVQKPYKIIDIRSSIDHPKIQKRFEVSEKLLSGKRPHPEIVVPEGKNLLQQLLWTIQLGDFTSLYLAILNGLNPTPVDLIVKLKTALND